MICYEIVNPSDMATFLAPDRDIALAALAFIGDGAYGGTPLERDGEGIDVDESAALSVPIFLFGGYEEWWKSQGFASEPIESLIASRKPEIVAALRSASYGSLEDRRSYDSACAAIDDPAKLTKFKEDWEDRRRSSMNRIVQRAWAYADALETREAA